MDPGFRRYHIHTSCAAPEICLAPRIGEREGPIAKQWEGEGHPVSWCNNGHWIYCEGCVGQKEG